jgi:CHAD domain-containing protein
VQLLYVEAKLKSFPEARAFRNALRGRERRLVRRVGARMRCTRIGRIKSGMAGLRKAVRRVLADQPHEQAHRQTVLRSVNQAFARVVALRDRCRADDLATIHRLRIAFKAFRYVVELLQPVLPGVTKRKLDTLHAFQNRLGEIQDADVLVAALDKFSLKHPENAAAVEAFHRDAERRRSLLVREFLANADRIHQFWPPHPPGLNHTRRPARRIRSSSQRHRC